MVKISKQKDTQGFTLLEMLISITLFSMVVVIALSAVLTILDLNQKTQSLTAVTNSMNTALDSMVRLIKSGERGFSSGSSGAGCPDSEITFDFYDIDGIYGTAGDTWEVTFQYDCDEEALFRSMVTSGSEQFIRLTPEQVRITHAEFDVTTDCQDKARIHLEGFAGAGKTESSFEIQTAVTRRSVVGTGSCL